MEFTIEDGRLYMLQTRSGKRTALAAVKIAVDMVKEGLLEEAEAVMRVTPKQVDQLLHPMINPKVKTKPIAKGLPASAGAAIGQIVFNPEDAEAWAKQGICSPRAPWYIRGLCPATRLPTVWYARMVAFITIKTEGENPAACCVVDPTPPVHLATGVSGVPSFFVRVYERLENHVHGCLGQQLHAARVENSAWFHGRGMPPSVSPLLVPSSLDFSDQSCYP